MSSLPRRGAQLSDGTLGSIGASLGCQPFATPEHPSAESASSSKARSIFAARPCMRDCRLQASSPLLTHCHALRPWPCRFLLSRSVIVRARQSSSIEHRRRWGNTWVEEYFRHVLWLLCIFALQVVAHFVGLCASCGSPQFTVAQRVFSQVIVPSAMCVPRRACKGAPYPSGGCGSSPE